MDVSSLIFLAVGLVVGIPLGWLFYKSKEMNSVPESEENKIQLKLEVERSKKLGEDLQTLSNELRSERQGAVNLSSENATLKANYENLQGRLKEQKGELDQLQAKFAHEFKNLANEIFEEKSRKFTDQNKINLDQLLQPLGQKLTDFEKKVEQTNKESLERSTALREQIIGLKELNDRMSQEAENLTKALKGRCKNSRELGRSDSGENLGKIWTGKRERIFCTRNATLRRRAKVTSRCDY